MKHLIRTFAFLTAILFVVPAYGQEPHSEKTLRIASFHLPPLIFTNENGEVCGLYPDLITRIAQMKGRQVDFIEGSWSDGLERLQNGEIDLIPAIAFSPARNRIMDFTHESIFEEWGQVFFKPGNDVDTLSELDGKLVAITKNDISGENFIETAQQLGISCQIIPLASPHAVFRAVQKGEAVAGVATQHFGLQHARDFNLVASPIQFSPFSIFFAAKKGYQETWLGWIDSYIYTWKQNKDSYYYNRLSYWTGAKKFEKETIPHWLLIAIVAFAVFATLQTYINRTLNKKVQKRTRELRSSEKQYRDLVESANSIILRMDKYGRVLFMNRFGLDFFGYSKEEFYGENVIGTILTEEEARAKKFKLETKDTFELPKPLEVSENENICKDGRQVFIQWSNRPIIDVKGRFQEILCIGTDITQRRQLETSLTQAQKMEAIGTLAGGIAHDFNNILTVIFGYTELATLNIDRPEKVREALSQVRKGGNRAKELVSQILTFSRKSESEKQALEPSLIVKETVKLLRPSLPATITLEHTVSSDSRIKADPTQIHQIIMNLSTNAYHAMETTGGTLLISLKDIFVAPHGSASPELPQTAGDYVLLEISDTGSGIAPEALQKIFDPYFTTKSKDKGTGLGLAVVHGIVKEHKGHIHVQSKPGAGTTFQVYLPHLEGEAAARPESQAQGEVMGGSETILVIDDEKAITATLTHILSRHGYTVRAFTDGEAARLAFLQDPQAIDLVLTDMTMPGITGAELARDILSVNPDLPVILCSGYSDLITLEKARELGIDEYLQKPVMMTNLLQTVRKLLDKPSTLAS